MPNPKEADDVALDLPPSDGSLDDDNEGAALDLDEDDDEGEESIGLDVSVGFDQEADLGDLIEDLGEGHRWTGDNDVTSDQINVDARDLSDGDEDGWTTDNEAAGESVAHREDELDDGDLPTLGSDSGDEGLDEDAAVEGDNDAADLPPIDAGEGDQETPDSAWLDASLLGRLDDVGAREGERLEVAPGVYWPFFPQDQIRAGEPIDVPVGSALLQSPSLGWWWANDELVELEHGARTPLPKGVTQTAVDPRDASVSLSSDSGLWRLESNGSLVNLGGPSADPAMIANATITFTTEGGQSRLWAQSKLGTLFARLTEPTRWSLIDSPRPGRHLASDGRRSLAYILSAPNRPCALTQSLDGGTSWSSRTLAISDVSLVQRVLVCRDVVVIVCDSMVAPVLVADGDEEPAPLLDGLRAPVALSFEDSEVVLYGCVVTPERSLLIRQPLGQPRRRPSVVISWDANDTSVPTAISATYVDGRCQLLVLAGGKLRRLSLVIERDNAE